MASRPEDPAERSFSTSFRGYDQIEVRAHLRSLTAELSAARSRVAELESGSVRPTAAVETPIADLDDAMVAARLGDEAARVLRTAHEAALEMRAKAAEHMDKILREAQDDASRIRTEADVEAARRREAAAVEAAAEIERAKAEGRHMIGEAQAVRERMMSDLARRRDVGRRQVEHLAHGRDRLLAAYDQVRSSLDSITAELEVAVPEAQALAGDGLTRPLVSTDDVLVDQAVVAASVSVGVGEAPMSVALSEAAPTDADVPPDAPDALVEDADAGAATDSTEPVEAQSADDLPADGEVPPVIDLTSDDADPDDGVGPEGAVDELFARLRASRTASVARAVEVLAAEPEMAMAPAAEDAAALAAAPDHDDPVDAEPSVFQRRQGALELIERSIGRHLKRTLADEQNEVLERLRRAKGMPALEELVGSEAEHAERYRTAVEHDLRAAVRSGALAAGATEASAEKVSGGAKVVVPALDEVGLELIGMLRSRIGRCLDDAQDPDDASNQLRATYREVKVQRIDGLAAHFAVSAYGKGSYAALPAGAKVTWHVDPGGSRCADCDDNHLGGAVDKGGSFPTGHANAPAHLGCRCLVVAG